MRRALLLLLVSTTALAARPPAAVEADRAAARAEVRDLERRVTAVGEELARKRGRLQERVRALYKLSNGGWLRLVDGAGSLRELDERRAAAARVLARDVAELAALRAEMRDLEREQARRKEALARALDPGARVPLADLADAVGLARRQGQLVRPVAGAVVAGFGAARDPALGVELARRGVALRSHAGEPVRAVAAGRVRWIGDVPGLGRGVAIDHGDGWVTLTAELGRLRCAVGDEVGDADVIAEADGPTVYLELAQDGTPLDPAPWLAPR